MDEARTARVWSQVTARARAAGEPVSAGHACLAAAAAAGAFGATLTMARGGALPEPVFATDPRSEETGELQSTLGEGPGVDAMDGQGAVLVADLASTDSERRWPAFAPAASALGVHGMFSLPIRAGGVRLGVLDLYRGRSGPLTGEQLADVLAFADIVLVLVLDRLGGGRPHPEEFVDGAFSGRRAVVHQAAGMMSVQLDVTVAEALARLRAHAYAHDRWLAEVAADVVARRLWFDPGTGTGVAGDTGMDRKEAGDERG